MGHIYFQHSKKEREFNVCSPLFSVMIVRICLLQHWLRWEKIHQPRSASIKLLVILLERRIFSHPWTSLNHIKLFVTVGVVVFSIFFGCQTCMERCLSLAVSRFPLVVIVITFKETKLSISNLCQWKKKFLCKSQIVW